MSSEDTESRASATAMEIGETHDPQTADPTEGGDGATRRAVAAHVVEFMLGGEKCAIDIRAVDSIVEPKQITRVPRAPAAVDGVMDLRGETTAILDPREFLSIEGRAGEQNILVLDRADDKQKIGIRVDEVTEVATYHEGEVDQNGELAGIRTAAIEGELVRGVIRKGLFDEDDETDAPTDVELVLWLDIDRLIDAVE